MTDIILQMCDITSVDTIHFNPFTFVDTIHFNPFTFVDTIHSFHIRGHYYFLSRSFLSGPITESNYFPSYVGLHPTSSFN